MLACHPKMAFFASNLLTPGGIKAASKHAANAAANATASTRVATEAHLQMGFDAPAEPTRARGPGP
jgi:hypothetical protein